MFQKFLLVISVLIFVVSCSGKKTVDQEDQKKDPFKIYQEAFIAFERGDYFFANKKFSEAELNFENVEYAAKASIMSSYALYGISFYDQALDNLNRYLRKYPADINIIYAQYLKAIIYYEQISDEKKDLKPLIKATEEINFFLKKYPNTDYAIDLKFKKDLIQNQLAAKELYVAKYYISVQKWVPAIKRLKVIVEKYQETVFVEEALHRLVEIYSYLGIERESKRYAKILGYNYNSSKWFQQSYKLLNKDYKIVKKNRKKDEKDKNFFEKILKKIR